MKLTVPKILAGGVALFSLMFTFALARVETPETRQTAAMHSVKSIISDIANRIDTTIEIPLSVKQWALQRAYVINNNTMVRWDSIDVSDEKPDSLVVKTERIIPTDPVLTPEVIEWTEKNMLDASADVPLLRTKGDNVCARHHMHKVTSRDGLSWRCKR